MNTETKIAAKSADESEFLQLLSRAMYGKTPEELAQMLADMADIAAGREPSHT